ncbi:MAG: bifunctional diaminohydroxyphosphoribosylaminopyrimidine deaminase/5-amino-6-(5-phosphoribosylamino)uracil reductase RibD [Solirubrobacterales bacterium]
MNSQLTGTDQAHLARALELAERGRGRVSPNPLVGAVLAREAVVIGEGWHRELGALHAEVAALQDCRARGADPAGASMYVTLEPCAHQGRQPPCVDAILESGLARVVIASEDPSEWAGGRGPGALRDRGVAVEFVDGEQAAAARLLNQPFRKHARTGLPLITLKLAMSLAGQTATAPGESGWISAEPSRALVHRWRAESDAIAIGIGTALADDPLLTARSEGSPRQPLRVIFDRRARLPLDSRLLLTLEQAPVILIASPQADQARVGALHDAGAEVLLCDGVEPALAELGRREITSIFLEGGPTLAAAFAACDQIDESRTFIAPLLLPSASPGEAPGGAGRDGGQGGEEAGAVFGSPARGSVIRASAAVGMEMIGEDVLIRARFREW